MPAVTVSGHTRVSCPRCSARIGQHCLSLDGQNRRVKSHRERVELAMLAAEKAGAQDGGSSGTSTDKPDGLAQSRAEWDAVWKGGS